MLLIILSASCLQQDQSVEGKNRCRMGYHASQGTMHTQTWAQDQTREAREDHQTINNTFKNKLKYFICFWNFLALRWLSVRDYIVLIICHPPGLQEISVRDPAASFNICCWDIYLCVVHALQWKEIFNVLISVNWTSEVRACLRMSAAVSVTGNTKVICNDSQCYAV